jgi:hypothetical protein
MCNAKFYIGYRGVDPLTPIPYLRSAHETLEPEGFRADRCLCLVWTSNSITLPSKFVILGETNRR